MKQKMLKNWNLLPSPSSSLIEPNTQQTKQKTHKTTNLPQFYFFFESTNKLRDRAMLMDKYKTEIFFDEIDMIDALRSWMATNLDL